MDFGKNSSIQHKRAGIGTAGGHLPIGMDDNSLYICSWDGLIQAVVQFRHLSMN